MTKLQQWLDEMDKLDREATPGPWDPETTHEGSIFAIGPAHSFTEESEYDWALRDAEADAKFISRTRTELPRAVKIIKWILESYTGHNKGTVMDEIEKILGEGE